MLNTVITFSEFVQIYPVPLQAIVWTSNILLTDVYTTQLQFNANKDDTSIYIHDSCLIIH